MKYAVSIKGSASIKSKVFASGKDFTAMELNCNKKEIDQLIKDGVISEVKEPEKVISELDKANEALKVAQDELKAKDAELVKANTSLEAKTEELDKANEALKVAQDELKKLKAKK